MKKKTLFLLVFSCTLISRIPFLNAGFGNDQDGWRVGTSARYIGTTGEYVASRLPGFPVFEYACSLVWQHGAWAMNFLSAFMSAAAAAVLALIARRYGSKDPMLLALTFASVPIVFISSTITMDYLWAMFFIMLCWYAGLAGRPILAGIALGVAIGCRITSAGLSLPLVLLFVESSQWKKALPSILKFWLAVGISAVIVYLPVFHRYGMRFFTFFDQGLPPVSIIARYVTLDVWGLIGTIAVLTLPIALWINRKKPYDPSIPRSLLQEQVRVWIAVLIFFVFEFAAHPKEGAYLMPAIPFLLLAAARFLPRIQCITYCILLIASSFFMSIDSADRPWSPKPSPLAWQIESGGRRATIDFLRGPVLNDHTQRLQRIAFIEKVLHQGDTMTVPSVIVVGPWLPYIVEMTPTAQPESEFPDYYAERRNVMYIPLMTNEFLRRFQKEDRNMYYLPSVDIHNMRVEKLDLDLAGARKLKID